MTVEPAETGGQEAEDEFLARFEAKALQGKPMAALLDWPEQGIRACEALPERFAAVLETAASTARDRAALPNSDVLGVAAFDELGRLLSASRHFAAFFPEVSVPRRVRQDLMAAGGLQMAAELDRSGRLAPLCFAKVADAAAWPQPDGADERRAAFLGLCFRPTFAPGLETTLSSIFGFTGFETRVVTSLIETRHLPAAADLAGVSYESAREAIASARSKAGVPRQNALIDLVLRVQAGHLGPVDDGTRHLVAAYGLTERQARAAILVAFGVSREHAADAVGVTLHVIKQDLKAVYERLDVRSAVDLTCAIGEVVALGNLAAASEFALDQQPIRQERTLFVNRRRMEGRIGVCDYGPDGGMPVVWCHSLTTSRRTPEDLVMSLQEEGFRIISFDRPGFTLTTAAPGDPFDAAADDLVDVLDHLDLPAAHVLARGGIFAVLAFARRHPERFLSGLLINPEPPADRDKRFFGPAGLSKKIMYSRPQMLGWFAQMLINQTGRAWVERMMRKSLRHCKADMAVIDDARLREEYIRTALEFAAGPLQGFIAEQSAYIGGHKPEPMPAGGNWAILAGAQDAIFDYDAAFWNGVLPGHRCRIVPDAGRLMHVSHTALVARSLRELARPG